MELVSTKLTKKSKTMKALVLIEKFEKFMDKVTYPIVVVCSVYLIVRVLVSFVFDI